MTFAPPPLLTDPPSNTARMAFFRASSRALSHAVVLPSAQMPSVSSKSLAQSGVSSTMAAARLASRCSSSSSAVEAAAASSPVGTEDTPAPAWTKEAFYARTRLPVEQATTLPPILYTSDEVLAHEARTLFKRNWVCVGHRSELANHGDVMPIEVRRGGRDTAACLFFESICRSVDGVIFVLFHSVRPSSPFGLSA